MAAHQANEVNKRVAKRNEDSSTECLVDGLNEKKLTVREQREDIQDTVALLDKFIATHQSPSNSSMGTTSVSNGNLNIVRQSDGSYTAFFNSNGPLMLKGEWEVSPATKTITERYALQEKDTPYNPGGAMYCDTPKALSVDEVKRYGLPNLDELVKRSAELSAEAKIVPPPVKAD